MRRVAAAQAVVELGDHSRPQRGAELAKGAGTLGNGHGDDRFAGFAQLGALGDEAQAIEVHVGAAQDRGDAASAFARQPRLQSGDRQRAGRLHDAAGVVEHVLDRGANLVVRHPHDLVDRLLREGKRQTTDLPHRHAVGEDPDAIERHATASLERSDTSHRPRTARRR